MDNMEQPEKFQLFTIGHSNHAVERFLDLLKLHAIEVVVDTRSGPYSRYVYQYNKEELQAALKPSGIKYLYLGRELGGRPDDREFYDEEGYVLYSRLAESQLFLAGIQRLESGIRRYRVAILCSEENPEVCHRHLLVGRVMAGRGITMLHIRGDGRLQQDCELLSTAYEQRMLPGFEVDTWKSLQSVLRKKQPRNSSESFDETESNDSSMSD